MFPKETKLAYSLGGSRKNGAMTVGMKHGHD